ncbi:DcrB-related protein [Serratia fonticola]|uniref:DcrB-related protein n=1 Tax=Serratia fonticola TaxID=47917 RepID=A0AAW3WNE2_SERFO|nr:DcrB-related protein [Serratia fonticola]MBC3212448.1 DcrB-related protein [Serratia fonticola]NYA12986.1 DcrB-related protein [Serratia fonticola]NYA32564.1 DcrB-related protein [Serratia fonticola]
MFQISDPHCVLTEGSIALPDGFCEQTVNILITSNCSYLNISRDQLRPDKDFTACLTHQCEALQKGQRKYQVRDEQPTASGDGLPQEITLPYLELLKCEYSSQVKVIR